MNKLCLRHYNAGILSVLQVFLPRFFQSCKIWHFHGSDYKECRVLGYENLLCTSQETHYVSTTESSRLKLCKIWGLHGNDSKEWRLLGYKNLVRTSQETHYVSTTESNRFKLCKIWGLHGDDWDIKTLFVLQRRHITSPLQSPVVLSYVRFEVYTATTMKNGVFWDIKTLFVLHRRHITSPLQSPVGLGYVRFEVYTAMTMKNGVFWDIKPCSYFKGDTLRLQYRVQSF
jgi:hypothetical protein